MQTAVGVFGGEAYTDGINVPPLMNDNVGDSGRPAISSLNAPPFIAVELCREHLVCNAMVMKFYSFEVWTIESINYFSVWSLTVPVKGVIDVIAIIPLLSF